MIFFRKSQPKGFISSSIRFINTESIKLRSVNYIISIPESVMIMDSKAQNLLGTQFFHLFRREPVVTPYFANKEEIGVCFQYTSKRKDYNISLLESFVDIIDLKKLEKELKFCSNYENRRSNLIMSIPLNAFVDIKKMSKAIDLDISQLKLDITIEFTSLHSVSDIIEEFLEL